MVLVEEVCEIDTFSNCHTDLKMFMLYQSEYVWQRVDLYIVVCVYVYVCIKRVRNLNVDTTILNKYIGIVYIEIEINMNICNEDIQYMKICTYTYKDMDLKMQLIQ